MVKNKLQFVIICSHFQFSKIIFLLNKIMNFNENEITHPYNTDIEQNF